MQSNTTIACNERGLALITVVLIVAIASTIASFMSLNQQIWFRQTTNILDRAQVENLYRSAIDFATVVLERDAKDNDTDSRGDLWALPLTALPIETGTVSIRIDDAQGRFNLNNVVKNGQASSADIAILRRLFNYLEIEPSLVESLVDWIDKDSLTRPDGAEDTEYLASESPYRCANHPLGDIEELRLIRGFSPDIIAKLRGLVTALPAYTATNVNTALPPVLGALFKNMPLASAESLAKTLASEPVTSANDITKHVDSSMQLANVSIGTKSTYFLVSLDIADGRHRHTSETLVYRPTSGSASRIVQRGRPPLHVAATEAKR